jgi:hypothetical protein
VPRGGAFQRGLASAFDDKAGETLELAFGQVKPPFALIMQDVLAKACMQHRQTFRNLRHPRLGRRRQRSAPADQIEMDPPQQPRLVGVQDQKIDFAEQGGDPVKQFRIKHNLHPVPRQNRRQRHIQPLQRRPAQATDQIVENRGDAFEPTARALHRCDGVGKIRGRRIFGNRRNLTQMRRHRLFEGQREMFGPDTVERRQAERGCPFLKKRVVLVHRRIPPETAPGVKRRLPAR